MQSLPEGAEENQAAEDFSIDEVCISNRQLSPYLLVLYTSDDVSPGKVNTYMQAPQLSKASMFGKILRVVFCPARAWSCWKGHATAKLEALTLGM